MKAAPVIGLFISGLLQAPATARDAVYAGAVNLGGQIAPLFANGYLVYLHLPNRLQVFRPDTLLAYEYDVPCPPQISNCTAGAVAVSRKGIGALSVSYATKGGYASGIRLLDTKGEEIRFIDTGRYVPRQLAFDKNDDIWAMGWQRDRSINERESSETWDIVRKYSSAGALKGEFLPRTLWASKHGPELGGRGYWTMYAAGDRVGAMFNENFADATPEWIEWDLDGTILHRIPLVGFERRLSRAFDGNGRLYAQFHVAGRTGPAELKVLDKSTGKWMPVSANLPDGITGFLVGADGDELVYRVNRVWNVRLVWARPGHPLE